ncbi:hypothetical protein HOY80DRAFT_1048148 [Tuber brumale]|nr:hypothetical protein HOY80DRAFT_1048148 [Tuber brumale]
MAQPILHVIRKALENYDPRFLAFAGPDRPVALLILENLQDLRCSFHESGYRLYYSARDGYLRLVSRTELHECPLAWMDAECVGATCDVCVGYLHQYNKCPILHMEGRSNRMWEVVSS